MSFDGVSLLGMLRRAIRGRIIHINQVGVDELASLSTEQLLDRLRAHLRPQGLATTFGGRLALLDVTIHHQDIRRPLGMPRQIPAERLALRPGRQRAQPRAAGVAPRPRRTPDTDRPGLESRLGTGDHRTGGSRADGGRRSAECHRGAGRSRAAGAGQPARPLTHPCSCAFYGASSTQAGSSYPGLMDGQLTAPPAPCRRRGRGRLPLAMTVRRLFAGADAVVAGITGSPARER